jgi:hypothetical protein
MAAHRFKAGQKVLVVRARTELSVPGMFEIIRPLPEVGGRYQYRIRSVSNGQERVAGEYELEPAQR